MLEARFPVNAVFGQAEKGEMEAIWEDDLGRRCRSAGVQDHEHLGQVCGPLSAWRDVGDLSGTRRR
jgi:hypothetical protein